MEHKVKLAIFEYTMITVAAILLVGGGDFF